MILCLFWLIGIETSSENFLVLNAFGLLGNFVFCGMGFFWGLAVPDENNVKLCNLLTVMVFIATNGAVANLDIANWFIKFLSRISPSRYNNEGFFRCLTNQIPDLNVNIDGPTPVNINLS